MITVRGILDCTITAQSNIYLLLADCSTNRRVRSMMKKPVPDSSSYVAHVRKVLNLPKMWKIG